MNARLWVKGFKDYIVANISNLYTDDITLDDYLILFKESAGANMYDRPVTIREILDLLQATIETGIENYKHLALTGKASDELSTGYNLATIVLKLTSGSSATIKIGLTDGGSEVLRSYDLTAASKPFIVLSIPKAASDSPISSYTIYSEVTSGIMDVYLSSHKFIPIK